MLRKIFAVMLVIACAFAVMPKFTHAAAQNDIAFEPQANVVVGSQARTWPHQLLIAVQHWSSCHVDRNRSCGHRCLGHPSSRRIKRLPPSRTSPLGFSAK
jgi:hypothetical protein